jgi:hypothetical protein
VTPDPRADGGADADHVAFDGHRRLAAGPLHEAARAVVRAAAAGAAGPLLILDATGRVVDVDLRGTEHEVAARLQASTPAPPDVAPDAPSDAPRRPGRPKLGVVAREVTLLPRHWEWLAAQPGGASVALRRLVDEARHAGAAEERARRAREAAYRFLHAVAGDLPGFEEASRALFAGDAARFRALVAAWPPDVRDHATALAFGGDRGD